MYVWFTCKHRNEPCYRTDVGELIQWQPGWVLGKMTGAQDEGLI